MRKKFNNIAILIAIVLALFSPAQGQSAVQARNTQADVDLQSDGSEIPTDRIIIKYKDGTSASFAPALAPQMDRVSAASTTTLEYVREMGEGDLHVLELPERLSIAEVELITQQLEALPEVEYAEPDRIYTVAIEPDDPLYDNEFNDEDQWHFHQTWGINLPDAWDITFGSPDVIVAVVDTGVTDHPELADRTVPGYDFITNIPEANDGNGRDANPSDPGDWVTDTENNAAPFSGCAVTDSTWHGTHVAGTIGAQTNNTAGVAGIDWNAKILPVRVLGKCGGYESDILDGMLWAAGLTVSGVPANPNPAHIINLSLGLPGVCSQSIQNVITEIVDAGVIVVAAAGNTSTNVNNYSPANCVGVIAVGATDIDGQKPSYSNFGARIDISAPGGDSTDGVLSTSDTGLEGPVEDSYEEKYGTSMAAPHVSGVLALMFAVNPGLTPSQALQILENTAKAFPEAGTCTTSNCGEGIVDAAAAVAAAEAPDLIITGYQLVNLDTELPITNPTPNQPFGIRVIVKNRGGTQTQGVFYRSVYINRDPLNPALFEIDSPDGCLINLETNDTDRGDYTKPNFIGGLPAGATDTDTIIEISNPETEGFPPEGLSPGSYQIWLYADPTCIVQGESFEGNNAYGPIPLTLGEKRVFSSVGVRDGWILESNETSNLGNIINSDTTILRLGDDISNKQYVSILDFTTVSLPDNAVITSVFLRVKQQSIVGGGNLGNIFQGFMIDIKRGTFGTPGLTKTDFQASEQKVIGPLKRNLNPSGYYIFNLTAGKNFINKLTTNSGITQIRLHFKLDDNNNNVNNILQLFSGNASVLDRPKLIIQYYIPEP